MTRSIKHQVAEWRLTFTQKVVLNAVMVGNDMTLAFQQLYEVPLLQTWGVPVGLVSLYPVVTGPLAVIILSVTGFYSDKGTNHRYRKMACVIFNSAMLLTGLTLVGVANMMYMSQTRAEEPQTPVIENLTWLETVSNSSSPTVSITTYGNTSSGVYTLQYTFTSTTAPLSSDDDVAVDLFSLPATAVVGMIGIMLYAAGYDCNISAIRSCVLACSPSQDHTSLLALALVLAALGGCITCILGLVDLTPLLSTRVEDSSLPAQTTVQLVINGVIVIGGIICTITMSHHNAKRLKITDYLPFTDEDHTEVPSYGSLTQRKTSTNGITHGDSKVAALGPEHPPPETTTSFTTDNNSKHRLMGGGSGHPIREERCEDGFKTLTEDAPLTAVHNTSTLPSALNCHHRRCRPGQATLSFIVCCACLYMGASVLFSYNMYVSDFVGKELFGGDPSAPAGSPELKAYEDGVGLSSSGLLLVSCCYLVVSIFQDRILARVGVTVDFCVAHFLMAACVLALTLGKELPLYYVACVAYGAQRSALYTVPYVLASQHSQGRGKAGSVGKSMAVMTCMIPLSYCTIYLSSGPLIQLTGNDATPLLVAAAFSSLAALTFLVHGTCISRCYRDND